MTIAAELAKRTVSMRYEDLPAEAVRWAKISFIDTIGCAFAGIDEPCSQIARRVLTTGRSGTGSDEAKAEQLRIFALLKP